MENVVELKNYIGMEVEYTDKKMKTYTLVIAEISSKGARLMEPGSGAMAKVDLIKLKELITKKLAKHKAH